LSADRSAADSFPDRAALAARPADDMLRIGTGPKAVNVTNLDRKWLDPNVYRCQPAHGVAALEHIAADLAHVNVGAAEKWRLR